MSWSIAFICTARPQFLFKSRHRKSGKKKFTKFPRSHMSFFKHTLFLKLGIIIGVSVHSCKGLVLRSALHSFTPILDLLQDKKEKCHLKHLLAFFHYCTSFSRVAKLSWKHDSQIRSMTDHQMLLEEITMLLRDITIQKPLGWHHLTSTMITSIHSE